MVLRDQITENFMVAVPNLQRGRECKSMFFVSKDACAGHMRVERRTFLISAGFRCRPMSFSGLMTGIFVTRDRNHATSPTRQLLS